MRSASATDVLVQMRIASANKLKIISRVSLMSSEYELITVFVKNLIFSQRGAKEPPSASSQAYKYK